MIEQQTIPEWAKLQKAAAPIIFDGRLRRYRADVLAGTFRWADNAIGETLSCQIFDSRWAEEVRWVEGTKQYFDIAFIDSERVASCLSLSRDSAVNVSEYLRNLRGGKEPINPMAVRVSLRLEDEQIEGSKKPFYCVITTGHEFCSEAEFDAAVKFAQSPEWEANKWLGVYK